MKVQLPSTQITPGVRCEQCPLYHRSLHFHVATSGPEYAPLLFVNDFPLEPEVSQREYFNSPSGRYFKERIKRAGIPAESYRVTALVKCRPKTLKGVNYMLAARCCNELLEEDLFSASVVVGLGAITLEYFTGFTKLYDKRGSIYPVPDYPQKHFIPTIAPKDLAKQQFAKKDEKKKSKIPPPQIVELDLEKAQKILDGTFEWDSEPYYDIAPSEGTLDSFLKRLWEPGVVVGVDIETTYDIPDLAVPEIIGFALEDQVITVDFLNHLEFIANALISPAEKVFQNGLFDMRVLNGIGLRVENYGFDTMYAHHLLFSELAHGLGFLTSIYTSLAHHKDMVNLKDKDNRVEG